MAPREQLLAEWLAVFSAMVDRGLAARAAAPAGWIGLHYDDIATDPASAWRGVLEMLPFATPGDGTTAPEPPASPPPRAYDRSLPRSMTPAIEDLERRYRWLVFGA